jgi:hypothetical protein
MRFLAEALWNKEMFKQESKILLLKRLICLVTVSLVFGNGSGVRSAAFAEKASESGASDDVRHYSVPMDSDLNSPPPEIGDEVRAKAT